MTTAKRKVSVSLDEDLVEELKREGQGLSAQVNQALRTELQRRRRNRLLVEFKVDVRGCPKTLALMGQMPISGHTSIIPATDEDWRTEYLDLILAIKLVGSIDEAIDFINTNGSGLADAIVSEDYSHVRRFLREVDSATVYANASTRFTDGYEFGFGAEVGISTNRLHARGPMGLRELTTYKYIIYGNGQVRE